MSGKFFFFLLALFFIGIGIRSIIKKEASWRWDSAEHKPFSREEQLGTLHFTGPIAVIIGIIEIAVGVILLFAGNRTE